MSRSRGCWPKLTRRRPTRTTAWISICASPTRCWRSDRSCRRWNMLKDSLTGNRRVRCQKRLFRAPVLVLQVEVRTSGYEVDGHGGGRDLNFVWWRDAQVEDIGEVTERSYA